jgi:hypothetical protein
MPVVELARSHGISTSAIYLRARTSGWRPRPVPGKLPRVQSHANRLPRSATSLGTIAQGATSGGTQATSPGIAGAEGPAPGDAVVIEHERHGASATGAGIPEGARAREPETAEQRAVRLLHLIDLQLIRLEEHMQRGDLTPQDQERIARTTASLKEQAEDVTQAMVSKGAAGDVKRDAGAADLAEAERLRVEIAERIERLNAKWLAEKASGGA